MSEVEEFIYAIYTVNTLAILNIELSNEDLDSNIVGIHDQLFATMKGWA